MYSAMTLSVLSDRSRLTRSVSRDDDMATPTLPPPPTEEMQSSSRNERAPMAAAASLFLETHRLSMVCVSPSSFAPAYIGRGEALKGRLREGWCGVLVCVCGLRASLMCWLSLWKFRDLGDDARTVCLVLSHDESVAYIGVVLLFQLQFAFRQPPDQKMGLECYYYLLSVFVVSLSFWMSRQFSLLNCME